MSDKWYENWFNSPYYHILYFLRNDREAEYFIDNLCGYLKPHSDAKMLDIACGKGRHAVYLNQKGFDVTGIDLSYASIRYAKQFENEKLRFFQHDMRNLLFINYFDIAFNLFTSFGYFDSDRENLNALKTFRKSIKPNGTLVLDYFNSAKILKSLKETESKNIEGIDFYITKHIETDKIVKTISFEDRGKRYSFQERVKAFSLDDFERLFSQSGFKVKQYFGNYSLDAFDSDKSDRIIFICSKN